MEFLQCWQGFTLVHIKALQIVFVPSRAIMCAYAPTSGGRQRDGSIQDGVRGHF